MCIKLSMLGNDVMWCGMKLQNHNFPSLRKMRWPWNPKRNWVSQRGISYGKGTLYTFRMLIMCQASEQVPAAFALGTIQGINLIHTRKIPRWWPPAKQNGCEYLLFSLFYVLKQGGWNLLAWVKELLVIIWHWWEGKDGVSRSLWGKIEKSQHSVWKAKTFNNVDS